MHSTNFYNVLYFYNVCLRQIKLSLGKNIWKLHQGHLKNLCIYIQFFQTTEYVWKEIEKRTEKISYHFKPSSFLLRKWNFLWWITSDMCVLILFMYLSYFCPPSLVHKQPQICINMMVICILNMTSITFLHHLFQIKLSWTCWWMQ